MGSARTEARMDRYRERPHAGDWLTEAACRDVDPEVFYPNTFNASPRTVEWLTRPARTICSTCPVRDACYDYAARNGEDDGVWGGVFMGDKAARRQARAYLASHARCDRCGNALGRPISTDGHVPHYCAECLAARHRESKNASHKRRHTA